METKLTVLEFLKNEISKENNLKKISDFIDSCVMFHVKNCKYINCSNCSFVDHLAKIYIINYQDENQKNQVKIIHEFLEEYFGDFYLMIF